MHKDKVGEDSSSQNNFQEKTVFYEFISPEFSSLHSIHHYQPWQGPNKPRESAPEEAVCQAKCRTQKMILQHLALNQKRPKKMCRLSHQLLSRLLWANQMSTTPMCRKPNIQTINRMRLNLPLQKNKHHIVHTNGYSPNHSPI